MDTVAKKRLISSYVFGIRDTDHGERFGTIMRYFLPEFVSALVLYSALYLLDATWIADLRSTSTYAALGVTNTLLHMIIKIAEGVSVGMVVIGGQYNGAGNLKQVGRTFADTFWMTLLVGGFFFAFLYWGAPFIYGAFGVPVRMAQLGIPFLRTRAFGVFFTFMYFAVIGFLRSIKNTRVPMVIFASGALVFLFFDYALIFGKFGFPALRLQGSALASVIQYAFMLVIALSYVLLKPAYHVYGIQLFSSIASWAGIRRLLTTSWQVVADKAIMAGAYIWLGAMIAPLGKYALASFAVIKDMERFAILPAVAFAQVITFMVSNDFGAGNWVGIKSNVKKMVFLSSFMVVGVLAIFAFKPTLFIQFFDKKGTFTGLSASVFPLLSVLIFFDLLQLVLSGALRGAANVTLVMTVRLIVCAGFFVPASYIMSRLPISNQVLHFFLIYSMFFVGNAIMSMVYINRFRTDAWLKTNQTSGE